MAEIGKTDICNIALGHIAAGHVQNIDTERSVEAVECKRFYDQAVREVLAAHDWSFARHFVSPAMLSGVDIRPGWSYVFDFPPDALKIRGIARWFATQPYEPFEIGRKSGGTGQGRVIYCNLPDPVFVYTTGDVPELEFDPLFTSALAWLLASYLAMPVTKKRELRKEALAQYSSIILQATASNLNESALGPDIPRDAEWIENR